jgi:tRNA(His) guanylyltransferase
MKNREMFSNLITVPPVFVRLDGRAFHRLSERLSLARPFDERFHETMVSVTKSLVSLSGLNPDFGYTFSDEISLYFSSLPFGGRVEKIDSVAASFTSSAFSLLLDPKSPIAFDARIIQVTPELAQDYLMSRQHEAWRNHLNSYCQTALVNEGMSSTDAQKALHGMPAKTLHEMMYARGINLAVTPSWQRRGSLVYKRLKSVQGFNPVTHELVDTLRSSVITDSDLPLFNSPEGRTLLSSVIGSP